MTTHSYGFTPGYLRYYERYQKTAPRTQTVLPPPDSLAAMDVCANRAREMYREFAFTDKQIKAFWDLIPNISTAENDMREIDRFSEIMREQGDFDKALVIYKELR